MEALFLISMFIFLLLIGVSVAGSMILSATIYLVGSGMPLVIVAERFTSSVNSYTLMAVPFFIFAAIVMNRAGVTSRLLGVASCIIGGMRGGTAQVNILGSVFFAGMSGSATADVASQGRMLIPRMVAEGYDRNFAAGVTAAASIVTSVIPPAIIMIIYGSVTSVSIGALFFSGIVPGLLMALVMMAVAAWIARRRNYPKSPRVSRRELGGLLLRAMPALLTPVLILGGIRFGLFTPTEAGVLACVYGLLLGLFVYRELRVGDIPELLVESVEATALPMYIIASSAVFGFALTVTGFGFQLEVFLKAIASDPTAFIAISLFTIFVVGLFVEATSALLIFVPMFAPIARSYGVDEVHYGILVIMTLMVGTITPPVGLQLFIASDIAGVRVIDADVWPFVIAVCALILLIMFFPAVSTFLPGLIL